MTVGTRIETATGHWTFAVARGMGGVQCQVCRNTVHLAWFHYLTAMPSVATTIVCADCGGEEADT